MPNKNRTKRVGTHQYRPRITLDVPHNTYALLHHAAKFHNISLSEYVNWVFSRTVERDAIYYDWQVERTPHFEAVADLGEKDLEEIKSISRNAVKMLRNEKSTKKTS